MLTVLKLIGMIVFINFTIKILGGSLARNPAFIRRMNKKYGIDE